MKLHTRDGGRSVDSEDESPFEPYTKLEVALMAIIVALLAGAGGVWLYMLVRYVAPLIFN